MSNSKAEARPAVIRWLAKRWWILALIAIIVAASSLAWHEWLRFDSAPPTARQWSTQRTTIVAFSPDSRWLAFNDGTSVVVHHLPDGREVRVHPELAFWRQYAGIGFTPDSRLLIVGGQDDGLIECFDVEDGTRRNTISFGGDSLCQLIVPAESNRLFCIRRFSRGGESSIRGELVSRMNATEREEVPLVPEHLDFAMLALSTRGDLLARGDVRYRSYRISVYDFPSGKLRTEQVRTGGIPWSLAIDGESKRLANADRGLVRIWTLPTLEADESWEMPGEVQAVAFNRKDGALCAGSMQGSWLSDGVIRVWNSRGERLRTWTITNGIHCLAISPDGRWLATGSRDGGVQLWEWERVLGGR